jgi:hypothetical protein
VDGLLNRSHIYTGTALFQIHDNGVALNKARYRKT